MTRNRRKFGAFTMLICLFYHLQLKFKVGFFRNLETVGAGAIRTKGNVMVKHLDELPIKVLRYKVANRIFQTNKDNSFLSFLTMIGPSPDWCVGQDSVQLCNMSTCEWIDETGSQLFPIDMGTDDGISFLSQNNPRKNPADIKMIAPSSDQLSPFYGESIKPFAEVRITKINERLDGSEKSNECNYSSWNEWSKCSSTCKWGVKEK